MSGLRVGMTIPQFGDDGEQGMRAARAAEEAGLDGVFVFDHLYPLGHPERPALYSHALLGALAVETSRVRLGSLVARVGLLPDAVLVHSFETVQRMSGGRLIAGVGTGDRLSRGENLAFAVAYAPVAERLRSLQTVSEGLRRCGITTWVGGLSPQVQAIAASSADELNLWGVEPARLATVADVPVNWGGVLDRVADVGAHLEALAEAGATWAIFAIDEDRWEAAIDRLVAARPAGSVWRQ